MTRSSLNVTEEATTTYLSDDRRATISRWMKGNPKLGPGVYSYSRLPGKIGGTCPGSTEECESICYAKRIVGINKLVTDVYRENSLADGVAEDLPTDARLVRIHVSGDFDTTAYTADWIRLVRRHPDVKFWGYTRSWRVHESAVPGHLTLAEMVTRLRDEPNVQLFASVDQSSELPPDGWRCAWIDGDPRLITTHDGGEHFRQLVMQTGPDSMDRIGPPAYVCPEETGRKKDCASCNYCITGKRGDVVFLKH